MRIIESWQDHCDNCYGIVKHSKRDQVKYHEREYEAVWADEDGELWSFGGTVGYTLADFDTLEAARDFLLKGISERDTNPEIFLEMVEV